MLMILCSFCKANIKSVFNIKVILSCFELASGLKANFLKSSIGGVGVDHYMICRFPDIVNYKVMKTPFKYLEMLVGGGAARGCHRKKCFGKGWWIE